MTGDLHHRIQTRLNARRQRIATVFLAGGLALVAALLIQAFVGLVQITIADFGDDVQVARTLLALSFDRLGVVIPGAAAMTSAAAVASLRFAALPAELGVLALFVCVAAFVMYWIPVWLLWVVATALVLLALPAPTLSLSPSPGRPRARSAL